MRYATMRIISLLSCIFLTGVSAAVIDPLSSLNSSKDHYAISQQTSVGAPDPRFDFSASLEGPNIPMISYLMNTVEALVKLSLEDFSGTMKSASWRMADYPEVGMTILAPYGKKSIERRFVLWGLSLGAAFMMDNKRFRTGTFTLKWNGVSVGTIMIIPWPYIQHATVGAFNGTTQGLIRANLPTVNTSAITPACTGGVNAMGTINDEHLRIQACLTGSTLDLVGVFRLVNTVLVDVAVKDPTDRVHNYVSPRGTPGVLISFIVPTKPPLGPPFFEVQWLVEVMASIPDFLIKKGLFQELLLLVDVDGVRVAEGFLKKIRPSVDLSSQNPNISIS